MIGLNILGHGIDMNLKSMLIWALRRTQTKAFVRQVADAASRLDKFNAIWRDAFTNVPFYTEWKAQHGLPDAIAGIAELSRWPILEKKDLILNRERFVRKDVTKFHESVTGGATGEPLHFRTMAGESDVVSVNKWIGWARMGIYPDSRCFVLWGHRHFYGQTFTGNLRFAWRQFKDWMTNNLRADATDLSQTILERDVKRLISFRPEGVIAYSASLLALVRSCKVYRERCQRLGIKAIICTAGPLTKEEREEIGSFFSAPVGMEYGSMEGGVMAYQTPMTDGHYEVFDKTHIIHAMPEPVSGNSQVLVTKLYPSYLPLIRYKIGDYILDENIDEDGTVKGFREVYGRTGDEVDMGNGIKFHGQSFMTCAEGFDKIIAYQIRVNKKSEQVVFVAQTLSPLDEDERNEIIKRASHMSGLVQASITVQESNELVKAPSGKIRLVVDET